MLHKKERGALLFFIIWQLIFAVGISKAEEKSVEQHLSEQELATEKFLSTLDAQRPTNFSITG